MTTAVGVLHELVVSARATAQDALVNLLQSTGPSQPNSKLSAATKSAMVKRGLSQTEVLKAALDRAVDEADMALRDDGALRAELAAALKARDEAIANAHALRLAHEQGLAQVQVRVPVPGLIPVLALVRG